MLKWFIKRKLRKLLNDKRFLFRSLPTLTEASGLGTTDTIDVLNEIGARPSRRSNQLWGLVGRVGHKPRRRYRNRTSSY